MILAIDVAYHSRADGTEFAQVAGVSFTDWQDAEPKQVSKVQVQDVAPYQAGQFYKRELPCIMALLQQRLDACLSLPKVIVVDGYVYLGVEQKAGLGLKLHQAIQEKWQTHIPIIGVAKNYYKGTPDDCALCRGQSEKPVFITSVGMTLDTAKACITDMHGEYRLPTLLKLADSTCRETS